MNITNSLGIDLVAARTYAKSHDMQKSKAPDYKRLTYPQLRSFCEVARRNSMKAAAEHMDVAQPTVWKQIRALEKTLQAKLIESHRRGTRLTEAGRHLLELCSPAVNELETVADRFAYQRRQQSRSLVIASSPRAFHDDLPECVPRFAKAHPNVRLLFREVGQSEVVPLVETGEADIGLADIRWSVVREEMDHEVCYEIEPVLAVPANHQLSTRKRIQLEDLARYPLLNARDTFPSEEINAALNRVGAYDHPGRSIELVFAHTILRYVQLGHGIGLVGRARGQRRKTIRGIVEFSMAGILPTLPVHAVYRSRINQDPIQTAFISTLRNQYAAH